MFMTKAEVEHHLAQCMNIVGNRLGVGREGLSEEEFVEQLGRRFEMAGKLFAQFTKAYREWYAFHERIERDGHSGKLSEEERRELHQHITERDEWRKSLLLYLDFVTGTPRGPSARPAYGVDVVTQEVIDSARRGSSDEARDFLIRAGIRTEEKPDA